MVKAIEKARKTHLEGYNPYAVAAKLADLEDDAAALKLELSPVYSEIILKFSTYQKPQQDRCAQQAGRHMRTGKSEKRASLQPRLTG